MLKKYIPIGLGFATPFVAFAQNIQGVLGVIQNLLNLIIPILITLAVVTFFWGLAKFIWSIGGEENAKADGKKIMLWGLVALFVMVSIWGIIGLLGNTFSIRQGGSGSNLVPRVQ